MLVYDAMGGPVGHKFKAGVLVVGSEMLLGRTRDTNTIFLAENLLKKGIRLMRWVIVPDDKEMIGDELRDYIEDEYDMVMISGGMGPTHDDVTVEAVANALSVPLAFNEECFGRMLRKWRRRNPDRTFQESSRKGLEKMALVPEHFELINNEEGMVEGLFGYANMGRTMIFILPGVPREYRGIIGTREFQNCLPPGSEKETCIREVHFNGKESQMVLFLSDLQKRFPDIDIGSYPQGPNLVILRVTGSYDIIGQAVDLIQEEVERLHRTFPENG